MNMNPSDINPEIFRAYDIRGIVPDALSAEAAHLIGRAFATYAIATGATRIVVARDGRLTSPELASALIDGIVNEGLDTVDIGMVPTPSAYWAALQLADGNCAIVTGSHNPKQYNGIKMMLDGQALSTEDIQSLLMMVREQRYAGSGVSGKRDKYHNAMDDYAAALPTTQPLARPLKVVVDCGNGVMGPFASPILRAAGCEVIELFCDVDGNFPNHHPDPAMPENFAAAAAALTEHDAELALGFDGDGDRLGLWLPDRGMVFADRLLMLLAQNLLQRLPGATIVFDVKCSRHVAQFVAQHGGKPHLCRTGHSFMKRELRRIGAPLGGELSGHFFFNEGGWCFDDALLAALKLLKLVAAHPSATQLCAQIPDSYASPEYKIDMPADVDSHDFVAKLTSPELYPDHHALIKIDGVRVEWQDGFGLIRASNTAPGLIMRFEGDNEASCSRIKDLFRTLLQQRLPDLVLPF